MCTYSYDKATFLHVDKNIYIQVHFTKNSGMTLPFSFQGSPVSVFVLQVSIRIFITFAQKSRQYEVARP